MNKLIFILLIFLITSFTAYAESKLEGILPSENIEYVIRIDNGDLLSGYIIELVSDEKFGEGIKFKTAIGTAKIYEYQIVEIRTKEENYRHRHRVFLMPSAEPIGDDHFIGSFEILFLYGGFGLFDILSFTVGRSFIPGIRSDEQATLINAKATFLQLPLTGNAKKLSMAVGSNIAWINHNNRFVHHYFVTTVELSKTLISGGIFYKGGSGNSYRLFFGQNAVDLFYQDGSFGLNLGLDTRLSKRHGLNVIGEIWNSDIANAANTGILLGLRHSNTSFSADFGLAFFTQPFMAPFISFTWTPF